MKLSRFTSAASYIAEVDIDPRMERFVLYISTHDIYQKFYTSRFSTIQKFTQKKPEDNKPVYRQSSTSSDDAEKPESWQQLAKRRKMERQEEASYMEYHFIKQNLKCSVVEG